MACLLEEMEGQQRQGVAGRCLCQPKYVKLPILLCTLQFWVITYALPYAFLVYGYC